MKELNELVELAKECQASGNPWTMLNSVTPATILAIAAAFRALEQRAEAAEELNKHLDLAVRKSEGVSESLRRRAEAAEAEVSKLLKTIHEEKAVALRVVEERDAIRAKLAELESKNADR